VEGEEDMSLTVSFFLLLSPGKVTLLDLRKLGITLCFFYGKYMVKGKEKKGTSRI